MNGRRILFAGDKFKSAGGEVANAQVCKTCIRGFDSRPALQYFNTCNAAQQKHAVLQATYSLLVDLCAVLNRRFIRGLLASGYLGKFEDSQILESPIGDR